MSKGRIHIGTSGWNYKHWKGPFYPADLPEAQQFYYYFKYFDTVELNNSFYMLPAAQTFAKWKNISPAKFIFSVKASRFITHLKKLSADKSSVHKFLRHAGQLDEKLGPVLFQLPPRWGINAERLETFLNILPAKYRYTFEFRDHSWYNDEIYDLLKKSNCAFCIYELQGHISPLQVTADFIHARLHGPGNKYQGDYTKQTLKQWARRCIEWQQNGKDVYIYFDNDQAGYAVTDALSLKEMLGQTNSKLETVPKLF